MGTFPCFIAVNKYGGDSCICGLGRAGVLLGDVLCVCFALQRYAYFSASTHTLQKLSVLWSWSGACGSDWKALGRTRSKWPRFPPFAHRSHKSDTASFQKIHEPEGLIFETQLLRLQVGLFVEVSESTQASRCPADPLLRWQQDFFCSLQSWVWKNWHPPYFLGTKLKIKQRKGG